MKVSAILTAAGAGLRLKQTSAESLNLPKAFWPLNGAPILFYSLKALLESALVNEIIITLPPAYVRKFKKELEATGKGIKPVRVTAGSSSRALSVYEGIKKSSKSSGIILVHDAARPFITKSGVDQVLKAARKSGAAIAAKRVTSTVKESEENGTSKIFRTVPREKLWEAETPQAAKREWLVEAYSEFSRQPFAASDEASLLENIGKPVRLVELGSPNLKITTGQDLQIAGKILNGRSELRIGHGSDIHRLVKGRPFILGGERLKWRLGPLGHSDGDALLHALSDAILGATGKGDIGEYFSDRKKKFKNISSIKILDSVISLARESGWQIVNADCTVHLEKPRLGEFKLKIRKRLAKSLKLGVESVNVKAKTREGFGPIGAGEAVACEATVLVKRMPS